VESGDLEPRGSEFRVLIRDFREATTALRQDFVELHNHVDDGFSEVRGRFDGMAAGQRQIVGLLQTIGTEQGHGGNTE
jgi:hypothetical protein